MAVEPLGGRRVVVGGHQQGGIGAELFGLNGKLHGLASRSRSGSGYYQYSLLGRLNGDLDHPAVLLMTEGGGFTGGSHGDDAGGTSCYRDGAVEDEVGWAGQGHGGGVTVMNKESHLKVISAANPHHDGRGSPRAEMVNQCRSDDTRAAG